MIKLTNDVIVNDEVKFQSKGDGYLKLRIKIVCLEEKHRGNS
jgi:hypothetical protein